MYFDTCFTALCHGLRRRSIHNNLYIPNGLFHRTFGRTEKMKNIRRRRRKPKDCPKIL
jgi:hypothetical protein